MPSLRQPYEAHVTFTLDGFKVKSPNRIRGLTRGAAMGEADRKRRQRTIGKHSTLSKLPQAYNLSFQPFLVDITIVRLAPRKLDEDNYIAACKHLRDGIADAFCVADDHPRIQFWYAQERGKPNQYAIVVEVRISRFRWQHERKTPPSSVQSASSLAKHLSKKPRPSLVKRLR